MASNKSTANGTGPLKPKIRKKTREPRSRSPKKTAAGLDIEQELDDLDQQFSVRVRERGPDSPPEGRPRSRLGALLRDPSPSAIKESIKRPLSGLGLLKRPGSRGSSKERKKDQTKDDLDLGLEEATAQIANGTPASNPKRKPNLFGEHRPGTAFGRRFSFGRKGKSKKGEAEEIEPDDDVDDLETEPPTNRRRGIVELPDAEPQRDRDGRNSDSPDIPQLEEVEGAAFGTTVAEAPSVAVNRVATYRELDSELMKHAAFATLEDIDLSLLTKFLCPESEVRDETVPWTWDYLYTNVCSELRTEWEEGDDEDFEDFPGNNQPNFRDGFRNNTDGALSYSAAKMRVGSATNQRPLSSKIGML